MTLKLWAKVLSSPVLLFPLSLNGQITDITVITLRTKPKHYFWMKDTFSSVSKGSESSKTQQLEYDLEEIIGVQTSDFEIHPSHDLDHSTGVIHSSDVPLSCYLVNSPWPLSRNLCKSLIFAVLTGSLREQWPATCTPCNLSVM